MLPAQSHEIIRGRSEYVGRATQEIAHAIAVVIDGVFIIFRRHHLRLAEFAGPRAGHFLGMQIAALDEPQRVEKLSAEAVRAATVIGKRGDRAQRAVVAHIGAEVALQSPERHDHRRRHAELLVDPFEYRCIGLDQSRAALNAVGGGHAIGKFQKCLGEHALTAIDIHDALIVGEKRRGGGDRLLRDALRHRFALEIGEPFVVRPTAAAWRGVRGGGEKYRHREAEKRAYRVASAHF